ncbi:hypothetical protein PJI17_32130, partial [Mycobacterium kansasii]
QFWAFIITRNVLGYLKHLLDHPNSLELILGSLDKKKELVYPSGPHHIKYMADGVLGMIIEIDFQTSMAHRRF